MPENNTYSKFAPCPLSSNPKMEMKSTTWEIADLLTIWNLKFLSPED